MDYPEHEKVRAIQRESQAIGEFMDWLQEEKNIGFAYFEEGLGDVLLSTPSLLKLLEEFFGIDPKKLEAEKQAMLDEIREEAETPSSFKKWALKSCCKAAVGHNCKKCSQRISDPWLIGVPEDGGFWCGSCSANHIGDN